MAAFGRLLRLCTLVAGGALIAGCATLPDTAALLEHHAGQEARFETARGPLSARRNAAVLAQLKKHAGNLDILDKQIALEQEINGSPLLLGNKATLLEDGRQTYPAMFAAIRSARDHINMETYIFEDDETGREFAQLLLDQQARGVQVNLIYDSVGTIGTPKAFFEQFRQGGVATIEFNPVNPFAAKAEWLVNHRDHRKLLIVDGRVAFLGGINVSGVYSSGSSGPVRSDDKQSTPWRDTDLRVEGPVVAEFQKLFLATWEKQHGPALAPRDYFPTLKPVGDDIVRTIGSTPDDPFSLMYLTLISAIGNAEKQVYLTNAYFVPDPQLVQALTDAVARGVDVRLVLPSHSDAAVVFYAGRAHYAKLLEGGVKIYEREGSVLHSKTALIDGVWSTVGSSNLDWRSFVDNDEIDAVILGRSFAAQMAAMFERDLAKSRQIDLKAWRQRPLEMRFKEWLSNLVGRLL